MLQAYVQHNKKSWTEWLSLLHLAYNNSRHSSHQEAPAFLLMGFKPQTPLDILVEQGLKTGSLSLPVQRQVEDIKGHRDAAQDAIKKSADKQAYQYNKRRSLPKFKVGEEVLINPHSLELLETKGKAVKLVQRYLGPFKVTKIISPYFVFLSRIGLGHKLPAHFISPSCPKIGIFFFVSSFIAGL